MPAGTDSAWHAMTLRSPRAPPGGRRDRFAGRPWSSSVGYRDRTRGSTHVARSAHQQGSGDAT